METKNHECYVSLEVAKLLKQASFDWEVYTYYTHIIIEDLNMDETTGLMFGGKYNYNSSDDYSAPTLDIAQRWLREVKGLCVEVQHQYIIQDEIPTLRWYVIITWLDFKETDLFCDTTDITYDAYESAQEAGIKKALEIILEKGE